ncbi:hypothetical protein SAMN05446927_8420 [Caballeronia arationis]|uniref:Uncharacterized protein n=1 Tax=Caballeronia arationis TaxID=1777142 RepID=A0A7Z7N858_9BURK|nr:hypothetical protein SAMN05446927_8420 [Caballeronia arationis]
MLVGSVGLLAMFKQLEIVWKNRSTFNFSTIGRIRVAQRTGLYSLAPAGQRSVPAMR